MTTARARYGLMVSALGAVVLAVSVFLPWYGLRLTPQGVSATRQIFSQAAQSDPAIQPLSGYVQGNLSRYAGQEIKSVSAHQALSNINVVLLVVAGLSVLISLIALAGPEAASSQANRGPLVLLGLVAVVCVAFRMVDTPSPAAQFISYSVREGAWLALVGSLAVSAGALWPDARARPERSSAENVENVWSELSGWTPGA